MCGICTIKREEGRVHNPTGTGVQTAWIGVGLNRTDGTECGFAGTAVMAGAQWDLQSPYAAGSGVAIEGLNYLNAVENGDATSATYLDILIGAELLG